ncbi:MAG TPA: 2-C-methyl-D-erythritol 4-phosphate cytidylyltransferase [Solirubrobacteraceae bacterium]|nr:2-C-methyl-D-erythritol 4-phosphate cytidylyltransferase [Solirubrobacteraceae bacterium]
MAVAILLAAGTGERLGFERAKAFVMLAGRPMLEWSLEAISRVPAVERVVVALPDGEAAPEGVHGVRGGASRSESVRAALDAAGPGDPVVVHDAARPLVGPELFESTLRELDASGCDGAIAAVPVTDTVKRVGPDRVVRDTLDRSALWAVQTPQAFRRETLERALEVDSGTLARATDDAWLVERAGGTVRVVPGPPENLKVTTPLELGVAELLLSRSAC